MTAMNKDILQRLRGIAARLGIPADNIRLEYPENPDHGDFSTNMAMAGAKKAGLSPRALAEKIAAEFSKDMPSSVASVDIAGPGFINFRLKDETFTTAILAISGNAEYGWSTNEKGGKVMVEYTDPNPFKVLHIGHLMSNAIGESISRLVQSAGANVVRANWQGDVGPHVAKAVWGALHSKEKTDFASVEVKWGYYYSFGANAYDTDEKAKSEIDLINKKIYERSDPAIQLIYETGRQETLEAFEKIYARLGTKFDNYFFEGTEGRNGEAIVREYEAKGIFEKSEGAVVFKGEKYGLHTRVFITSQGLPTYEAKELGLNAEKFKLFPDLSESIIITAHEQADYFKVLLKVFSLIRPDIAEKTKHLSHGMLRFASGKMSSRTGKVIAATALIDDIQKLVQEKMKDRKLPAAEAEEIADAVAIGAIKYTILRQATGGDVIFDSAASISFEGDSGPYLQYAAVRAQSILERAKAEKIPEKIDALPPAAHTIEKLLTRFPDVIARARHEYAPQIVANYLITLAAAFNSFYSVQTIIDPKDPHSPYYVALTKAFSTVMKNGLWLLGIQVPKKM